MGLNMILDRKQDCQKTWRSDRSTVISDPDRNRYRQHRCGLPAGHTERCRCRYDGEGR